MLKDTKIKFIQENKCVKSSREFLVSEGLLDEKFHLNWFATWDIETLSMSAFKETPKTTVTGYQTVATIAVHKNFGKHPRTRVFTRRDNTEKIF